MFFSWYVELFIWFSRSGVLNVFMCIVYIGVYEVLVFYVVYLIYSFLYVLLSIVHVRFCTSSLPLTFLFLSHAHTINYCSSISLCKFRVLFPMDSSLSLWVFVYSVHATRFHNIYNKILLGSQALTLNEKEKHFDRAKPFFISDLHDACMCVSVCVSTTSNTM